MPGSWGFAIGPSGLRKEMVRAFWKLARREVAGAPIPEARPWGSPLASTTQELW